MKLVICEKPSLGKIVASGLGAKARKDGYIEGNGYCVSWVFGHLYELYGVDDYLGEKVPWAKAPLPFYPQSYEFKSKKDVAKQLKILKDLHSKCDEIIHVGDADREGQIIVDILLDKFKNKKPVKRLWLSEQTDDEVKKQVRVMKDNSTYFNLNQEGLARTYLDWLMGINLTRHLTIKSGALLNTGRVIIPIVKFIYDRDMAIKNFVPVDYYLLESKANGVALNLKTPRFEANELDKAKAYANELNKQKAKVVKIETKDIAKKPPKLFSLSSLQQALSKKHNISFEKSVKIIQDLYEAGLITYPRTNTEYMGEAEKDKARDIIKAHGVGGIVFKDTKDIFDSSKVESHSAITITTKIASGLSGEAKAVYETVYNRFMANFTEEKCVIAQTTMSIEIGDKTIALKGSVIKQEGFRRFESFTLSDNLPNLKEGDEFDVEFVPVKKTTTPPAKISESILADYCKTPFSKKWQSNTTSDEEGEEESKEDDSEEYKQILEGVEIGTEATRNAIVKKCVDTGYISLAKKVYSIEDKGISFIEILDKLGVNLYAQRTVEFSKLLKQVYKGEKKLDDVLVEAKKEIDSIIAKQVSIAQIGDGTPQKAYKPSPKMVAYVESLAKKLGLTPPKGYKSNANVAKAFLDEHASNAPKNENGLYPPSQKQLDFARSIEQQSGVAIPQEALNDSKLLSEYINKNAVAKKTSYSLSDKQKAILLNPNNKVSEAIKKLANKAELDKEEYGKCKTALDKIFASWKK